MYWKTASDITLVGIRLVLTILAFSVALTTLVAIQLVSLAAGVFGASD
ncbi:MULTISPECIES: hypothetical protein [Mycobacteriales]|nr:MULTISPECIES: hypothetical protein [Mycobacteriales]ASR05571.1 hypothetical protein GCWB2_24000 [Gordonia rubripertincta]